MSGEADELRLAGLLEAFRVDGVDVRLEDVKRCVHGSVFLPELLVINTSERIDAVALRKFFKHFVSDRLWMRGMHRLHSWFRKQRVQYPPEHEFRLIRFVFRGPAHGFARRGHIKT